MKDDPCLDVGGYLRDVHFLGFLFDLFEDGFQRFSPELYVNGEDVGIKGDKSVVR